jgi:hypothetical protein
MEKRKKSKNEKSAFISVNQVRQDKPDQSSEMRGVHHVSFLFDM